MTRPTCKCCNICCPNLPDTLHAILDDALSGNCNCLNAPQNYTLTRVATQKWVGTGPFGTCGRDVTFTFYCVATAGQTGPTYYRLDVTWSDGCGGPFIGLLPDPISSTCSPFNVIFSAGFSLGAVCGCNGTPNPLDFQIFP